MNYLIGQQIEHYQIEAFLGEGGMGSVYRALDLKQDRLVALKFMHPHLSKQAHFQQRFAQEAQAASNFNTPSIVKIYQNGTHQDIPYIVMEYIAGGSLVSYLKQLAWSGNNLGLEEVIALAAQVADGLGYAHQRGVIHRDIKPDNILLKLQKEQPGVAGGAPRQAVLTDFGLAILLKKGEDLATNPFMGSLPYMSPEQCANQPLDGRSDIYSLGIMLYQLTTGQLPFKINAPADIIKHIEDPPLPPRLVNPELPEAVETVILKILAKKPGDRYQTGAELAHTLRQTALTSSVSSAARSVMDHVVTQWVEQRWVAGVDVSNRIDVNQTWISEGDHRLFVAHQWEESRVEGMVKESFTIGRNPDNDIMLQDRGVSGQHVKIERSETGWEVRDMGSTNGSFLGAKKLDYDKPIGWNSDETLHIGPYSLKWQTFKGGRRRSVSGALPLEVTRDRNGQMMPGVVTPASSAAATAAPALAAAAGAAAIVGAGRALEEPATIIDSQSVSFTSDVLAVTVAPQHLEVQPGVESVVQITVANHGLTVEDISLRAEESGTFPSWMGFSQSQMKLMPDESQTVTLTLTPPQDSSLSAGEHQYAVIATTARSESVKAEGQILVAKWEDFQLDMHPTNLQENVVGRVAISDRSNFDNVYNIAGLDDSDALLFKFEEPPQAIRTDTETQQQWLKMRAGAEGNASFTIEPRRRAWFARDQLHSYEMRVRTETSEWQSLFGQVEIRPRISRRVLLFFIILMLLLGVGGYYGYKEIQKRNQLELDAVTQELDAARAAAAERDAEAAANSAAAEATKQAALAALDEAIASGLSPEEIATREAAAVAAGEAAASAGAEATVAAAEAALAEAEAAAAQATSVAALPPSTSATPTPVNAPPTSIQLSVTTVDEGSPIGTIVGTFSVVDPDGAALPGGDPVMALPSKSPIRFKVLLQSSGYTFSLVSGTGDTDNNAFAIDVDKLKTAKLLDFEVQSLFSVRVQVEDSNGGIYEQPIVISLIDKNDPPAFTSQPIVTGREDVPYSYSIIVTDPDAGDTPLITSSTLPSWLTLTDNRNKTAILQGTPTNDDIGNHNITLTATDTGGESVTQTFVLEIVNINDPPRFSSTPSTSATQDVLYSYSVITTVDPDANDTLTISAAPLPMPTWLTLTDNGDGTAEMIGTPGNADVGSHTVSLQVADAAAATDTQTFTIVVVNVNDAPVFTSTPVTSVLQDALYTYNIVTTDPDSIHGDTRSISVQNLPLPSWLNFVDNGDGTASLSGTPLNANVGNYLIILQVLDVARDFTQQSFTVDAVNVNDPPTAANDDILVDEGSTATTLTSGAADVLQNDNDIDPPGGGNNLSVPNPPTGADAPTHGALTLAADGTFSYVHDGTENFTDQFIYTVCDDGAPQLCATATVNITINPVNDSPVNTIPQTTQTTNEDNNLVVTGVSVNDDDIGSGDLRVTLATADGTLSLNVVTGLSFSSGTGTDDASMTFTGQLGSVNTALAAITYKPTQDFNGATTIDITTNDQDPTNPQQDADQIAVDVIAVNDPPQFDPISNLSIPENSVAATSVALTGVGPGGGADETNQTLAFTAVSGDSALTGPVTVASSSGMTRTLSIGPPGPFLVGSTNITVTLTDSGGGTDTFVDVFQVTITAVNDPPTFDAIADPSATLEGAMTPPTVSITGVGPGGGGDESVQCVTVSATSSDTNIVPDPTVSSSGCVSGSSTRTLTYAPANSNAFGTVTITVTAQDNGGTSNPGDNDTFSLTFQVTITDINDQPTFDAIANQTGINEDPSPAPTVSITGIDPGGGGYESSQTVSFSATSSNQAIITNANLVFSAGTTSRTLTYTPQPDANGNVTITVVATDSGGTLNGGVNTLTRFFQIAISAVNDPPVFNAITNQTVAEDSGAGTVSITGVAPGPATAVDELVSQTVNFTATSSDTSVIGTPSFTGSGATRTLNFTPVANANGTVNITVIADDGSGGTDTLQRVFQIDVTQVNDPPTFDAISNQSGSEDSGTINVSITGVDPGGGGFESGQTVSFSATSSNTSIVPNPSVSGTGSSRTLSYAPAANQSGSVTITVIGTDNGTPPQSFQRTFTIVVNPVNDAPVLNNRNFTLTTFQWTLLSLGDTVGSVIASGGAGAITDVDAGALQGIAVTAVDNSNGNWQYSTNGNGIFASWSNFQGRLNGNNVILLAATPLTYIRFNPNINFNSTTTITFRAWDQTVGTNGTQMSVHPTNGTGGATAFSTATDTASVTVIP